MPHPIHQAMSHPLSNIEPSISRTQTSAEEAKLVNLHDGSSTCLGLLINLADMYELSGGGYSDTMDYDLAERKHYV